MSMITFPIDDATDKLMQAYTKDKSVSVETSYINAKDSNGKPVRIKFECEALSDISTSEFGHSVFCVINNEADQSIFTDMEETAQYLVPSNIEFAPFAKEGKFFLRLKTTGDKYKSKIDPPINPKDLDKSPIQQTSILAVEATPGLWVNYERGTAGIFLTINNIVVDGGSKKKTRSKK